MKRNESEQITNMIRERMQAGEKRLSLNEAASQLALSRRQLQRVLKNSGTTFFEVLEKERQRRALELLRESEKGLEDIADQLGFNEYVSFHRAFLRWWNTPPGAFRARLNEEAREKLLDESSAG